MIELEVPKKKVIKAKTSTSKSNHKLQLKTIDSGTIQPSINLSLKSQRFNLPYS